MKRNIIYTLMLTLLTLMPAGLLAQSVTSMQYWFDDGSKHTISISEGANTKNLSTDGLSVGMHTLYYRFIQSGAEIYGDSYRIDMETEELTSERTYYGELEHSPVYSSVFFKHAPSEGSTVEYWFDNKNNHATTDLSGAEGETVTLDLTDINKFPLGFHQLNMRFSTPGKSPSAIYSADVMKFSAGSRYLQYWVDDNYSSESPKVEGAVMTAHLDNGKTRDDVVFSAAQLSLTDVSPGLHHLYYRTCDANGVAGSAVYSTIIFCHANEASQIEYWFDDDASTIQKKQFAETYQNGAPYAIDLTSDVFPQGFHMLNIRVSTKNSGMSAIYSTPVVKMDANSFSTVEFWLDNDRENVQTISGSLSSNGVAIVGDLDFSGADPGMHYLHYRAIGKDGKPSNAVGQWPIMVKSRYNVDNTAALTVKEQAYWFDNEEPQTTAVASPRGTINQPYTFDIRKLSNGNHTLHLQYANSAGIWNAPVNLSFTKAEISAPTIVVNASVEEGVVTLNFPSVAYGKRYVVFRRYPSGTEVKVADIKNFDYPEALQAIDTPVPGTYTYYVEGVYSDANGVTQKVRSAEVNVTVSQAASTIKKGTFYAILRIDGKSIQNPSFHQYSVRVNGQTTADAGYTLYKQNFGHFKIDGIPYGTELNISVESERYHFNNISLVVSENTSKGSYYIDGSEIGEDDLQPDNTSYDLVIIEKVHVTPSAFELRVWNGQHKTWSGNIIMKIISKEVKDLYDRQQSEGDLSMWYYLFHPNAGLDNGLIYTTAVDMHVDIGRKETKTLVLDILDLPSGDKTEDYYVYVYSKKDGTDEIKELGDNDYSANRNPQTLTFNPSDCSLTGDNEDKTFIDDYKSIMRHLKGMSKWGDPFALEINTFGNKYEDIIENLGKHSVDLDGFEKDIIVNSSQSAGMLLSCFLNDIQKEIKQVSKSAKKSLKVADGIVKVYDKLNDVYGVLKSKGNRGNNVGDNHKFFALSKIVLDVCNDIKADNLSVSLFPALSIYQKYLEVGEAMAKNIDALSNKVNQHYIWNKLYTGKGIYKIKVRKYSDKTEYFYGYDFFPYKGKYNTFVNHTGQIKSIKIDLIDPAVPGNCMSTLVKNECVTLESDGITIENVTFPDNKLYSSECEAWMTITWKNNRETHVPLLDENFVKHEGFNSADESKPITMTVELQSGTYMHEESIPNQLTFVRQK